VPRGAYRGKIIFHAHAFGHEEEATRCYQIPITSADAEAPTIHGICPFKGGLQGTNISTSHVWIELTRRWELTKTRIWRSVRCRARIYFLRRSKSGSNVMRKRVGCAFTPRRKRWNKYGVDKSRSDYLKLSWTVSVVTTVRSLSWKRRLEAV